ncbi:MAG: response regulator [Spirochaetota bacterium]
MSDSPLVLLVEDDDEIRLTLRDYLQRKGHRVLVASDGVGAIKLLIDHEVAVIVTDFRMELLGGDYWVRFLQKYCSGMPVFVMSGFLDSDLDVPYPCFTKPFDYGELEQRVKETIYGTG